MSDAPGEPTIVASGATPAEYDELLAFARYRVFIESDAADEDILAMLESPRVRRAIATFLERLVCVVVTNEHVGARHDDDKPSCLSPDVIRVHLAALRTIAGASRRLRPKRVDRRGLNLTNVLVPAAVLLGGDAVPPRRRVRQPLAFAPRGATEPARRGSLQLIQ